MQMLRTKKKMDQDRRIKKHREQKIDVVKKDGQLKGSIEMH